MFNILYEMYRNKTIKGGGEALPRYDIKDHIFFILKSRDLPNYTWAENSSEV